MDHHHHNHSSGHNHGHHSHHHIDKDTTGLRLLLTLVLNLLIPTAQVIGGLYANSMALLSDAAHNFSDCAALLISYFAHRMSRRGVSAANTFGYKRAEIVAAQVNAVLLSLVVGFILFGAVERLFNPQTVIADIVVWLAGLGIVGNGFSALLLLKDAKHNMNIRGAFLHMMGDLLTSVVVLIGGVILLYRPWYWLDPVLSFLIALYILRSCWGLLRESSRILMNATPENLDLHEILDKINSFGGVKGAHYLHAWNISASSIGFSCHIVVDDEPVSVTETLAGKIRQELQAHFGINHAVLQFETTDCGSGGLLCEGECTK